MRTSMADIEHALKGIDFPKSKSEIVSYAQSHGASEQVITDLQQLPDRSYTNDSTPNAVLSDGKELR